MATTTCIVVRKFITTSRDQEGNVIYLAEYRDELVTLPTVVKPQGCNSIWFINNTRAINISVNGQTNILYMDPSAFVNQDPRVIITSDFNLSI